MPPGSFDTLARILVATSRRRIVLLLASGVADGAAGGASHEWRVDRRSHVAVAVAGLARLGGTCCANIDEVPQCWLDGNRKEPTGRLSG